jgi:hypothetical protein
LDSEGNPFTSSDAIIFKENIAGPMIFEGSGTGRGAFIFKTDVSNDVIARFRSTTNTSITNKSILLYHNGDEIFSLDGRGVQINGTVTAPSFASGDYPIYGIREWAVINNAGTISNKSPNVRDAVWIETGRCRVRFTKALPTANYSVTVSSYEDIDHIFSVTNRTTTSVEFIIC